MLQKDLFEMQKILWDGSRRDSNHPEGTELQTLWALAINTSNQQAAWFVLTVVAISKPSCTPGGPSKNISSQRSDGPKCLWIRWSRRRKNDCGKTDIKAYSKKHILPKNNIPSNTIIIWLDSQHNIISLNTQVQQIHKVLVQIYFLHHPADSLQLEWRKAFFQSLAPELMCSQKLVKKTPSSS